MAKRDPLQQQSCRKELQEQGKRHKGVQESQPPFEAGAVEEESPSNRNNRQTANSSSSSKENKGQLCRNQQHQQQEQEESGAEEEEQCTRDTFSFLALATPSRDAHRRSSTISNSSMETVELESAEAALPVSTPVEEKQDKRRRKQTNEQGQAENVPASVTAGKEDAIERQRRTRVILIYTGTGVVLVALLLTLCLTLIKK